MRQSTSTRSQVLAAAALAVIILAFSGGALLIEGGRFNTDSANRTGVEAGTERLRQEFQNSAYLLQSLFVPSNGRDTPSDFLEPLAQSVMRLRECFAALSLEELTAPERKSLNGLEASLTGWTRLVDELAREAGQKWTSQERMDAMARTDMPLAEHHRAGVLASLDELAMAETVSAASLTGGAAGWMRSAGAGLLAGMAVVLAWTAILAARTRQSREPAVPMAYCAGSLPDLQDIPVPAPQCGDTLSPAMLRLRQAVHDVGRILRTRNEARELDPEHAEDASKELAEASFMLMDVVEEMATCAAEAARPVLGTAKTTRVQ